MDIYLSNLVYLLALQHIIVGVLKRLSSIDINQRGLLVTEALAADRQALAKPGRQRILTHERRLDNLPVGMIKTG